MATRFTKITLGPNDDGRRVDRILRKLLTDVPLSRIHRALRAHEITVNGRRVRAETRVGEGDSLEIAETLRGVRPPTPERTGTRGPAPPADPELVARIVHESADLLVVNKNRGELTHGADSLEGRVRRYLAGREAGVSFRPGPVHRLDRNTSGLVIFGASLRGARAATDALAAGLIAKRYVAIMEGAVTTATWEDTLVRDRDRRVTRAGPSGASATTQVMPVAAGADRTVALIRIATGRTHQIRAQAAHHGHPLAGDHKYGSSARGPYLLHAASLTAAPAAGVDFEHLVAPLPDRFRDAIVRLFGDEAAERLDHALRLPVD